MRHVLKKAGRIVVWGLGLLLGLVLLVLIVLQTPWAKDWLRSQIVQQANATLEGELQIDRLSGNLLRSITVDGVALDDGRGRPLARIDRLQATYWLPSLLGGELAIDSVRVEKPRVLVRQYEDGTMNVSTLTEPAPEEPPSEPSDFRVSLDRYDLNGGAIVWEDQPTLAASTDGDPEGAPGAAWSDLVERVVTRTDDAEGRAPVDALAATMEARRRSPADVPGVVLADALDLRGSMEMTLIPRIDNRLRKLDTELRTDTLPEPRTFSIADLGTEFGPDRLATTIDRLALTPGFEWRDVAIDAAMPSPDDETEGEEPPAIEEFFADLGQLDISRQLVNTFLEGTELKSDLTIDGEAGGTLSELVAYPTLRFSEGGSIDASAALDLTGKEPSYRVAMLGEKLVGKKLVTGDLPETRLNLAARASGTGSDPAELTAETDLAVWDSAVDQFDIHNLSVRASAAEGTYRLETLELDSSHIAAAAEGSYGLEEGEVELHAEAKSQKGGLSKKQLGVAAGPQVSLGRADLSLDVTGDLDLEAETPLGYVERADVRSKWDMNSVRLDDTRLDASRGRLSLTVDPNRRMKADARATVAGLRTGDQALARGKFTLDASGRLDEEATELGGLRTLASQWSATLVDLRAGGAQVGRVEAGGSVDTADSPRSFATELEAQVRAIHSPGASVETVETNLDTQFTLAKAGADFPIEHIDSEGQLTLEQVGGPSFAVDHTQLDFDLEGPPLDPVGEVGLQAEELRAADRRFSTLAADIEFSEGRDVELKMSAEPVEHPKRPYRVAFATTYGAEFDWFTFDSLSFGRPEQRWRLIRPSTIRLGEGAVSIDEFRIKNGRQRLAVDGTYRQYGAQDLDLRIEKFSIGGAQKLVDVYPVEGLDGRLDLSVSLGGTARQPELDLSGWLREATALDYGPFGLALEMASDGSRIDVAELEMSMADHTAATATADVPFRWNLAGETVFDTDAPIALDLTIQETSLEHVNAILPNEMDLQVSGALDGSFSLKGTVENPSIDARFDVQDVTASGELAGTTLDLETIHSSTVLHYGPDNESDKRIDFTSDVSWRDRRIFGLELASDAPLVEWGRSYAEGRLGFEELFDRLLHAPLTFAFILEEADFANLPIEVLRQADAEGTLSGKLAIDGPMIRPTAEAAIDLDNFGWNHYRDIFVDFQADLDENLLSLSQFRIEWDADEILVARGKVPVPIEPILEQQSMENLPVDFKLQIRPLPLAKLSAIDYSFTQIQGTFQGYFHLHGNLRAPEVDARFAVTDAMFTKDYRSTFAMWVNGKPRNLSGGLMACRDDVPMLTGQYDLPVNLDLIELAAGNSPLTDGPVEASLQGKNIALAPLIPMPLLRDHIDDPEGYLHVDLGVEGTWEELQPTGTLALEDAGITLVDYGRRFEDIELATRLTEDQFVLEQLHVEEGEGVVEANGSAELAGFVPTEYQMEAETKQFDIGGLAADMPALVTSKASITGEKTDSTQKIDIAVTDLNVELIETDQQGRYSTTLSEDIVITETSEGVAESEIATYLTGSATGNGTTNIDFTVDLDRNSFVRHPNGYLNFSAQLNGEVSGSRTALSGQINSIRGEFEFLGRQFNVPNREGVVQFTGATPPNPRLDITAAHPIPRSVAAEFNQQLPEDPAIYVRVRGTANDPRLELTSEPTMSESDIVFVLMTGRAPQTAGAGEQQGAASQAAAAGGGILAGLLQQKLSAALPIDVLRVEAGEGGLAGSQLRVGKYITSDLFVSYAVKPGVGEKNETRHEVSVEYHFLPRWLIEATYGDRQTGELNVFWNLL